MYHRSVSFPCNAFFAGYTALQGVFATISSRFYKGKVSLFFKVAEICSVTDIGYVFVMIFFLEEMVMYICLYFSRDSLF